MDHLHWPLSVLSKAIHHKNLSAAADHIGLSQPQLSRLIAQLEEELGVIVKGLQQHANIVIATNVLTKKTGKSMKDITLSDL